jgi:predicted DNA-binding protein
MTLRLSEELDQRISAHAQQAGISKQQLVVAAIEQHLDREDRTRQLREVVKKVVTRDAELLDRLADA